MKVVLFAAALAMASQANAADLSKSEVDCLQRQIQLKQLQDNAMIAAQELAKVSLYDIPEAKLGGKVAEAKDNINKGMEELRSALKEACLTIYKQ